MEFTEWESKCRVKGDMTEGIWVYDDPMEEGRVVIDMDGCTGETWSLTAEEAVSLYMLLGKLLGERPDE